MNHYYQCSVTPHIVLEWDLVSTTGRWLNADTGAFIETAVVRRPDRNSPTVTFVVPDWAIRSGSEPQKTMRVSPAWASPWFQVPEGL